MNEIKKILNPRYCEKTITYNQNKKTFKIHNASWLSELFTIICNVINKKKQTKNNRDYLEENKKTINHFKTLLQKHNIQSAGYGPFQDINPNQNEVLLFFY